MIILAADLHIGKHKQFSKPSENNEPDSRLKQCLLTLKDILKFSLEENAGMIIFAGDFFDKRWGLEHDVLSYASSVLSLHAKILDDRMLHQRLVFVEGNHEYNSSGSSVLDYLETLSDKFLVVSKESRHVHSGNCRIKCVPYQADQKAMLKELQDTKNADLTIGHFPVIGASVSQDIPAITGVASDALKSIKLGFLGDFHMRQRIADTNCRYIGSPLQHSFGETGNLPGIVTFDENKNTWEYVTLHNSPKFIVQEITAHNVFTIMNDLNLEHDYYWFKCENAKVKNLLLENLKTLDMKVAGVKTTVDAEERQVVFKAPDKNQEISIADYAEHFLTNVQEEDEIKNLAYAEFIRSYDACRIL